MIANKCLVCGSSNLRADRALSGRLVCNSCGTPFGVGRGRNKKINNFNFSINNKYFFYIFILIVVFLLVIV